MLLPDVSEAAEHRYAVVIGADRGAADEPVLRYAESDARRVADVLVELGDVRPQDMVVMDGADADGVRAALSELGRRITAEAVSGGTSMLFVYYSGHADASALHLDGTELSLRELRVLVAAAPVDLRVLVVDACQAGNVLRLKGGAAVAPFRIDVPGAAEVEGMALITAAAAGEDAQESDRLQGGVFTHHLVAGLSGAADTSGDHRISLDEAYTYAFARTLATTSRAPVVQHPSYAFDLQGRAEVALTRLDQARRVGQLLLADAGLYVVFDAPETRLVAEAEVAAGGILALPAGTYRVRRRLPDRVLEADVVIRPGEQVRLAGDDMRAQAYGQSARRGETSRQHTAVAALVGGGVMGPLRAGIGSAPVVELGLRADLPWVTVVARGSYAAARADNGFLSLRQQFGRGEVAAVRLADLGAVSLGLGVAGGLGVVVQDFETEGEAPARVSLVGSVAPVARAELSVSARWTLGLEADCDIHLLPVDEGPVVASVVPRGGLDVTFWVR